MITKKNEKFLMRILTKKNIFDENSYQKKCSYQEYFTYYQGKQYITRFMKCHT